MTPTTRLAVLWSLRVHGPLSINDLADQIGTDRPELEPVRVAIAVARLIDEGLVEQIGPACYDVTEQGRAFLAAQPAAGQVETEPARQLGLFDEEHRPC